MNDHPDYLRSPENACRADRRNESSAFADSIGLGKTIEGHHATVSGIVLNEAVPENIRVQFETTKNLYFYSWFVYRFHSVAQMHAYACLELALRVRFEADLHSSGGRDGERKPGLRRLLRYAIKEGYLKNEGFEAWRRTTELRARDRTMFDLLEEMNSLGVDELEFDESEIVIKDEDRDHDYLANVLENTPELRNHYAHGSSSLNGQSLGSLKLAQEIINQLWPIAPEIPR